MQELLLEKKSRYLLLGQTVYLIMIHMHATHCNWTPLLEINGAKKSSLAYIRFRIASEQPLLI